MVFVDANGERTITTLGDRLEPRATDPLPWAELEETDAVYFTAGDVGALEHARRARVLVATSRARDVVVDADLRLDAVVGSGSDPAETFDPDRLTHAPGLIVRTHGARGGEYEASDGTRGAFDPVEPPGPIVDTYGAGDSFAAGLTFGLGSGLEIDAALALAARCGAWCIAGRGPYGNQLTAADLTP